MTSPLIRSFCMIFSGILFFTSQLHADNWPQWRGLHHNNISDEKDVPTQWSKTENVAWKLALPGSAGATPVVWDNQIFLTSTDGSDLLLLCITTDGNELWRKTISSGNKNVRGDEGNSASPSPFTDGKYVWTTMANGAMACFDMNGKEIWKLDLQERYGKFDIAFGMTSTPILYKNRIYLQLIHGDGNAKTREALVAAIDPATGNEIWRQKRPSDAHSECEHSYASPTVYDDGKISFLISHGADYSVGHDLEDGHEIWRIGNLNPKGKYNPTLRLVSSPTASEGLIVIPSAKNGPTFGLKPDVKGDVTGKASAQFWKRDHNTPDVPCPLIKDGLVYLCRENGNLICLNAKTGEEYYKKMTHRMRHRASPVYANGHLYLTARDGRISVIKAGKEFELVSKNETGESMSSTPVISNGTIYLRTFKTLWAIRNQK